ncbi:hypothetical protein CJF32_00002603 [Rutstroemia sp. NJR-2017a WRK4]|nr:hypothetical protein CJF32_00006360 [Rutstroemia sp. NJR-2017a WRK4]PQE11778.1 hypothetical protein CJF32_00002603 [Rutstroemia sp. NJR-2017a WRK4]
MKRNSTGSLKNHFVAALGEFVGTFLFLFFAYGGTQTANQPIQRSIATSATPDLNQLLYISLVFGFSLAINVWIFFRVSGGLFNPAVGIASSGNQRPVHPGPMEDRRLIFPLCRSLWPCALSELWGLSAQVVGSIAAAAAVNGLIPTRANDVLFRVALSQGTSVAQGLFLEMFFTIELVFTILMLAAEKTKATFVAPVGIGLALFVAELMGVYWTGGAVNPVRAFGADVIGGFHSYHWIYWAGPLLGASLAAGFYKWIKALNYEEVNGSQDLSAEEVEDKDDKIKRKREEKERRRSLFHHHFRGHHNTNHPAAPGAPAATKHQNTGAENGTRRASTGGFHSHRPSGDQGSMYTPYTHTTGGGSAGIPTTANGAVMMNELRPQYTPSGERYVQDIWAQDRVQDRVQIKYDG